MGDRGVNHVELFHAVAGRIGERPCMRASAGWRTYAEVADRVHRLANVLAGHNLTTHTPREELAPWQSGQDHIALYLHNGSEYLEASLAAAEARAAAFNVNYRYVEDELAHILDDAAAAAIVYHAAFAPALRAVLDRLLERRAVLLQVADGSEQPLLDAAIDYEQAIADASPEAPALQPDPCDLYILYTGGTTGMPKGTLWTQAALFEATIANGLPPTVVDTTSPDAIATGVAASEGSVILPLSPLMHGAAHWLALAGVLGGASIAFPDVVDHFDPADALRTIERERVRATNIIGDAFARPLCDELESSIYDMSSLEVIVNGGATLTQRSQQRLMRNLPGITLIDGAGASESGAHLSKVVNEPSGSEAAGFVATPDTCVVDENFSHVLEPGHSGIGWLARRGAIPLGYLGDPDRTARTFRKIGGERMVVPGDRARMREDGLVELLGRDAVTINSGGEKIFAEEVEEALLSHDDVVDAVVVGRSSERWGQEVVALVQRRRSASVDESDLLKLAGRRIARFKLPKAIVWVDEVQRSPAGKADYAWARARAARVVHDPATAGR